MCTCITYYISKYELTKVLINKSLSLFIYQILNMGSSTRRRSITTNHKHTTNQRTCLTIWRSIVIYHFGLNNSSIREGATTIIQIWTSRGARWTKWCQLGNVIANYRRMWWWDCDCVLAACWHLQVYCLSFVLKV